MPPGNSYRPSRPTGPDSAPAGVLAVCPNGLPAKPDGPGGERPRHTQPDAPLTRNFTQLRLLKIHAPTLPAPPTENRFAGLAGLLWVTTGEGVGVLLFCRTRSVAIVLAGFLARSYARPEPSANTTQDCGRLQACPRPLTSAGLVGGQRSQIKILRQNGNR